jgi:hypothetical protein
VSLSCLRQRRRPALYGGSRSSQRFYEKKFRSWAVFAFSGKVHAECVPLF